MVVGPTAVGKTQFAMQLAQIMNAEIISVDSRQIYRGFCIGTAQPTAEEQASIPHHLINLLEPDEVISAGDYAERVLNTIEKIRDRNLGVLIAGGSMLYIRAICQGIISEDETFIDARNQVRNKWQDVDDARVYSHLCDLDPQYAAQIHQNDRKRIMRALEIQVASGMTPTALFAQQQEQDRLRRQRYFIIGLSRNREDLYRRIENRVHKMLNAGWLGEVRNLIDQGIEIQSHAMQSLGYRQLRQVLDGELEFAAARENIIQKSRQFARRQLTWLRKMELDLELELNDS